jgi:hypothetical protein
MQHDRPGSLPDEGGERNNGQSNAELSAQIRFLEDEVALLRRKINDAPRHTRLLEQRLAEASERVSQLTDGKRSIGSPSHRVVTAYSSAGSRTAQSMSSRPADGCGWRCRRRLRRTP